jgi:hypothetical protein
MGSTGRFDRVGTKTMAWDREFLCTCSLPIQGYDTQPLSPAKLQTEYLENTAHNSMLTTAVTQDPHFQPTREPPVFMW